MKLLLDTCVLSELKQPNPSPAVKDYLLGLKNASFYISVISMGEIAKGIQLLDMGKRRQSLEIWLSGLEADYADRVLPVTTEIALIWGEILAKARKKGMAMPAIDGLIAATVIHHGLHLVTRNVSDFEASGVLLINPWEGSTKN